MNNICLIVNNTTCVEILIWFSSESSELSCKYGNVQDAKVTELKTLNKYFKELS